MIDNPAKLPARDKITLIEEPYVKATIITPPDYVGAIMETDPESPRNAGEHGVPATTAA